MAPKAAKKERAKPTKKVKSELEAMSESRHNMVAYLQPVGSISSEFDGIMEYLHRARINYAITTQHVAYQSHIKAFWNTAGVETVDNQEVIRAVVAEKPVVITENSIRERLRLGDKSEDPTSIELQCQRGLLLRIKYSENVFTNQTNKKFLPLRYKFLLHILIHCLSNKRSGWRREGSVSDNEEPALIAMADEQLTAKHGIKATRRSAGSSAAAARAEVDINVTAEEIQDVSIDPGVGVGGGDVAVETGGSPGGTGDVAVQSASVATDKGKGKIDEARKLIDESSSSSEEEGGPDGDGSSSDDDNPPPPGLKRVFDKRGNLRFEKIKKTGDAEECDKDEDYTLTSPGFIKKRKAQKQGVRSSKKAAGDSSIPVSVQPSTGPEQQFPPIGDQLTASETLDLMSSSPRSLGTHQVSVDQQTPETPASGTHVRTPLTITGPTGATGQAGQSGSSRPEPSRPTLAETLSGLSEAEKVQFLIEQISELGDIVGRHTRTIEEYRVQRKQDVIAHNHLCAIVEAQNVKIKEQADEIEKLKEANKARDREVEIMKKHSTNLETQAKALREKVSSRDDRLMEAFKPMYTNFNKILPQVGTLWRERCKQLDVVPSRREDDQDDDAANPDQTTTSASGAIASGAAGGSGTSQDPPSAPTASTGPTEETETLETSAGPEHISLEPEMFSDLPESSSAQKYHPVTGELLEEGEFISEMSDAQILSLTNLDEVDVCLIDATPLVQDQTDFSTIEEIFISSDHERPVYVGEDDAEVNALDDEFVADKTAEFDNTSSDSPSAQENREKTVNEWRADFLARNPPPLAPLEQANYMMLEKNQARGRIISWMFVKDLHCMVVKRETGLQYFRTLLSILTLPYYDVAVLAQLDVINRAKESMVDLFAKKIRLERRLGWKDPLYKPQFPRYEQIRFTLNPETNTARYRLVYDPPKVMKKIPLLKMKTDFLGNFRCWVYDADTGEAVILFRDNTENFRIIDPMWITNMSRSDIIVLKDHEINYLVQDRDQAMKFQRMARYCFNLLVNAGSAWSSHHLTVERTSET
ncbi:hypothetical protein Hdeb2414_s0002g00063511 [Helianthus debilis subsp. tardiflorus]